MPITPTTKVNEGSSCRLTFTLTDYDGTGIAASAITTVTMTLKDKDAGTVINSREDIDVSSGFDVTGGGFTWELIAADNPIVDATKSEEIHVATFTITSTAGSNAITLNEEVWITVTNLNTVS